MANTKISELTTWTGNTAGFYLVVDNSGLTQTYKVSKETLLGSSPTLLQITKTTAQTMPNISTTRITGWGTASISQNADEWNSSTGIFTATKTAKYLVNSILQMGSAGDPVGTEYDLYIYKNLTIISQSRFFAETVDGVFKNSLNCMALVSVVSGDTITTNVYHNGGGDRFINTSGTYLTIQQLPYQV
jgi:hypothetical protein